MSKALNKVVGATLITAGVAAKLGQWGLSVARVVGNGATGLAAEFVGKGGNLKLGDTIVSNMHGQVKKLSAWFFKKGKNFWSR